MATKNSEVEKLKKEFWICRELWALPSGKPIRDYVKAHREDIKECGIRVSIFRKYPHLPLTVSIISLVVSVVAFVLRLFL